VRGTGRDADQARSAARGRFAGHARRTGQAQLATDHQNVAEMAFVRAAPAFG